MIIHGESYITLLTHFTDNSVDSCVTDPPYALVSIGKRFGAEDAAPAQYGTNGAYQRASRGFMGKKWDTGEVAFDPGFWRQVLRVLKPGGHLVAFGGSRTYHRLACAIEDAGFEIRDQIQWIYGSGFPKSFDQGDGWGTALKPAHEPIVLARKPLIGTVRETREAWGTGAINVDGCRIDSPGANWTRPGSKASENRAMSGANYDREPSSNDAGRFPANVIHDGSAEVLSAFPNARGQIADLGGQSKGRVSQGIYGDLPAAREAKARDGGGSAARFFYCAKASKADREEGLNLTAEYETPGPAGHKLNGDGSPRAASRPRANLHPTVKPTDLMRYLCRLVTPSGGLVLDPFAGSGSTGKAAILEGFRFVGIEREDEYVDIARARIAWAQAQVTNV